VVEVLKLVHSQLVLLQTAEALPVGPALAAQIVWQMLFLLTVVPQLIMVLVGYMLRLLYVRLAALVVGMVGQLVV